MFNKTRYTDWPIRYIWGTASKQPNYPRSQLSDVDGNVGETFCILIPHRSERFSKTPFT